MTERLKVIDSRTVGSDGQHLKLRLAAPGHAPVDAIGFGLGEKTRVISTLVDVAYTLEVNEWNGSRSVQLSLQDVRGAG